VLAGAAHADVTACKMFKIADLPVRVVRNKLIADGTINGQKTGIVLDTGSMMTLILRPATDRLGLQRQEARGYRIFGIGGETKAESVLIDDFRIGQASRKGWRMLVAGEHAIVEDAAGDRDLKREHVVLQVRHCRVAADDVREVSALHEREIAVSQIALIPEAVAIARAAELIDHDPLERRTEIASLDMPLGQSTDPQIYVIDTAVDRLQRRLDCRIGIDLRERRDARQAKSRSRVVVIRQAMIAATLDVQRCQVQPCLCRLVLRQSALGPRIVARGGSFEVRKVQVARTTTQVAEVREGVVKGEKIVVEGAFVLRGEVTKQ